MLKKTNLVAIRRRAAETLITAVHEEASARAQACGDQCQLVNLSQDDLTRNGFSG
jgi:hypothetical protein